MKAAYVYNIVDIPQESKVGVVINIDRRWNKQRHCGIAFNLNGNPQTIHLATHNEVECVQGIPGFLCWVKPEMHPTQQEAFCGYLETLGEAVKSGKKNIPYGFLYDGYAHITPDGTLFLQGNECGLTCATFVLTLFNSIGFKLVDLDSWPPREEDKPWFFQILNMFVKHFLSKNRMSWDHFKRLLCEVGCSRYRPEEIAVSSAMYNQGAASTEVIRKEGGELLNYLLEIS